MEDRESNVERWVGDRLSALQPASDWQPDTARAYAALRPFDRKMHRQRQKRVVAAAAFAVVCLAALLVEAPKAYCAGPGCSNPSTPPPAAPGNFKESGSADAPITCEIYSDYQCPACAATYRDIIPLLMLNFVQTGKVRIVHRDFPLAVHPYARLAARYANAAGQVGEYDAAVTQLFRAQAIWGATGEIDQQLAQALPPAAMQRIRQRIKDDALDTTIAADIAQAREDQVSGTPTFVIVKDGRREKLPPGPSYDVLKSYLDGLLKPTP
jgi:protein-disulfide isomerase